MADSDETPIDVDPALRTQLERYYRERPRTSIHPATGRQVKLAPQKAPRLVFDALEEALDSSIPVWVAAFFSCKLRIGALADLRVEHLFEHAVETNRLAHESGAPTELRFFTRFASAERDVLSHHVYGFDAAPRGAPNASPVVRYLHTAKDPSRRAVRTDPAELARKAAFDAGTTNVDPDVYSVETIDSIEEVLRQPGPPFELLWEHRVRPPAPKPPEPPPPPPPEMLPERVAHAKFGVGRVVSREGSGDAAKYVVDFESGRKTMLARFLTPAD